MSEPVHPANSSSPVTKLGVALRLSGAGAIVAAGVSLAWPFRTHLTSSQEIVAKTPPASSAGASPADAVQVVFQVPGQTAPSARPLPPAPRKRPAANAAATPPTRLEPSRPADFDQTPPELPSQFTAIARPEGARSPVPGGGASDPQALKRDHRLVDGDTLQRIAQRYLGDAQRWPEIVAENPTILNDPNVLPIGKLIRIPARVRSWEVSQERPLNIKPLPPKPVTEPGKRDSD